MSDSEGLEDIAQALQRGRYVVAFGAHAEGEPVLAVYTAAATKYLLECAAHDDPDTRAAFAFGFIRASRARARKEHGCVFP